jgi:hypothetical protein
MSPLQDGEGPGAYDKFDKRMESYTEVLTQFDKKAA